jgi:hypothetical protein
MRIAPWRVVLTGVAVLSLGIAAIGVVAAGSAEATMPAGAAAVSDMEAATADVATTDGAIGDALLGRGRGPARLAAARHLVHLEVRAVNRAGEIVEHHLDHGTIQSVGAATLVIREADGAIVTVETSDQTVVRLGRQRGDLADLAVGDDVVIHSLLDGGATVARHVLRLPPPRT